MRIGIDIQSTIGIKTGIGVYASNLIEQFKKFNEIEFFYYKHNSLPDLSTIKRIYWENVLLPRFFNKDRLNMVHIPGFAGPRFMRGVKKIITVHDLIGIIYPENLAPLSRFYWQRWLPACVKNSDLIIADSEGTKKDIIRFLNIPSEKIKVVYLAAGSQFRPVTKDQTHKAILKQYGIDRDYILNVGTIEPRKNIKSLILAFNQYMQEAGRDDLLLVIAGKKGWDYDACFHKTRELGLIDKVIFCDYVKDQDLPVLYNLAQVFVYPSFYEGFGLPVLEAASCGAPVICSDISSLPEVIGEAALFVDPDSVDSIKNALAAVMENKMLKQELSRKAIEQSRKFSWSKTAAETIKTYKELLN